MRSSEDHPSIQRPSIDNPWAARVRLAQRKKLNWSDSRWQAALMALGDGCFQAAKLTTAGVATPVCLLSGTHGDTFILTSTGVARSNSEWRSADLVPIRPWVITPSAIADANILRLDLTQSTSRFNKDIVLAGTGHLAADTSTEMVNGELWVYAAENRDVLEYPERWPDDFPSQACFFDWLHKSVRPRLDFGLLLQCVESTTAGGDLLATTADWSTFIQVFKDIDIVNVPQTACTGDNPLDVMQWLAARCSSRRGDNALYAKTFFAGMAIRAGSPPTGAFSRFVAAWLDDDVAALSEHSPLTSKHENVACFLALWDLQAPSSRVEKWMLLALVGYTSSTEFYRWAQLSRNMEAAGSSVTPAWASVTSRLCNGDAITALPTIWAQKWALEYANFDSPNFPASALQQAFSIWDAEITRSIYVRFLSLSGKLVSSGLLPVSDNSVVTPLEVCMHYWPEGRSSWLVAQALGGGLGEWCSALQTATLDIAPCDLPPEIETHP